MPQKSIKAVMDELTAMAQDKSTSPRAFSVFSFFLSMLTVHVNESLQWLFTSHSNYSALQRPDAPQGRISPVSFTGSPISCDSTCPPNFFPTSVEII